MNIVVADPPLSPHRFQMEAAALIRSARGWSAEFNCWWLVRWVFARREGIEMPAVSVSDPNSEQGAREIRAAARASGWRPVDHSIEDRDIVIMSNLKGLRHVGVMVPNGHQIGLLHCEGSEADPHPGVQWETLADVALRYQNFEAWRRV
jgi:hypothetical protein